MKFVKTYFITKIMAEIKRNQRRPATKTRHIATVPKKVNWCKQNLNFSCANHPLDCLKKNRLNALLFYFSLTSLKLENFRNVLQSLQRLDASFNSFSNLPRDLLHRLPALIFLNLSHNNIEINFFTQNFPLLSNTKLEILDLSHNRIHIIGELLFNGLHNLARLYLDYNRITLFTAAHYTYIKNIKTFSFNYNNINGIYFPHTYDIVEFNLLGNNFTFSNSTSPLKGAATLQRIKLGRPGLVYYPVTFKNLNALRHIFFKDFSQPVLSSELFLEQPLLQSLKVEDGIVERITFEHMKFLSELFFGNLLNLTTFYARNCTQLGKGNVSFRNVPKLSTVIINGMMELNNFSTFLQVDSSNSIRILNFSNNNIFTITANDFQNFHVLEILDLSFNRLDIINSNSFTSLTRLKRVNLAGNRLFYLKNSFLISDTISLLNMSNNDIASVSSDWNVYLPKLNDVDISYNKIRALPLLFHFPRYYVEGNPWNCTCDILKTFYSAQLFLHRHQQSTVDFKCSSPLKYYDKPLHDAIQDCANAIACAPKDTTPTTWIIALLCVASALLFIMTIMVTIYACKIHWKSFLQP